MREDRTSFDASVQRLRDAQVRAEAMAGEAARLRGTLETMADSLVRYMARSEEDLNRTRAEVRRLTQIVRRLSRARA